MPDLGRGGCAAQLRFVHPQNRASWHFSLPAVATCVRALGAGTNMTELVGDIGMIHRAAKENMISVRNHVLDVLAAAMRSNEPHVLRLPFTVHI